MAWDRRRRNYNTYIDMHVGMASSVSRKQPKHQSSVSIIHKKLHMPRWGIDTVWYHLTRDPLGGGGRLSPLPDFLDSSKTAAGIDAKVSVPCSATIWHLPSKFQKSSSRKLWGNGVLKTSCFAILGKKGKCLKDASMYSFELLITQSQNVKRGKIKRSTKCLFRLWPPQLKM